ncbi:MAG: SGNH/GDSL hydrolase family protein [Clostridia bacterium]|nr:SGNH/GDSL hydrolase family protein [Clostridia bacterium]
MKKILNLLIVFVITLSCLSLSAVFGNINNSNDNTDNGVDWSNITISCLGDSITESPYIDKAYPVVLQEILGAKKCYNFGISGSTCALVQDENGNDLQNSMCLRYADMPKSSDIIIVMCGVNDTTNVPLGTINDVDISTYYGALNTLCNNLKKNYKDSYVFFMTNFAYSSTENIFQSVAIKQVCEKQGIDVFDVFSKVPFDVNVDTYDGCHPTQNFVSNVWTPKIAQFIKDNYKKIN